MKLAGDPMDVLRQRADLCRELQEPAAEFRRGSSVRESRQIHSQHRQFLAEIIVKFAREVLACRLLGFDEPGRQCLQFLLIPANGSLILRALNHFRCVYGVEIG